MKLLTLSVRVVWFPIGLLVLIAVVVPIDIVAGIISCRCAIYSVIIALLSVVSRFILGRERLLRTF